MIKKKHNILFLNSSFKHIYSENESDVFFAQKVNVSIKSDLEI